MHRFSICRIYIFLLVKASRHYYSTIQTLNYNVHEELKALKQDSLDVNSQVDDPFVCRKNDLKKNHF